MPTIIEPSFGASFVYCCADHVQRNFLPAAERHDGMIVFTASDQAYWRLLPPPWAGSDADWISLLTSMTGGGGGALIGPRTFTAQLGVVAPIVTGTNSTGNYLICSKAGTFTRWDMAAVTMPQTTALIVDVLKSSDHASTWFSLWVSNPGTRPTMAAGTNYGGGTSFDLTAFNAGDWLRFDVIQADATNPGQNVTVEILASMQD